MASSLILLVIRGISPLYAVHSDLIDLITTDTEQFDGDTVQGLGGSQLSWLADRCPSQSRSAHLCTTIMIIFIVFINSGHPYFYSEART